MRKQKKVPLRDFFTEYNHTKTRGIVISSMLAVLLSVSFVMVTQDVDTRGLMASVSNIANEKHYDADVVLESAWTGIIDVVFGSTARNVDSFSFTILSDPEKLTSLTTNDARATITLLSPGAYSVTMKLSGEDIYPGTSIVSLQTGINSKQNIALLDTFFESAWLKYNLTSKGNE